MDEMFDLDEYVQNDDEYDYMDSWLESVLMSNSIEELKDFTRLVETAGSDFDIDDEFVWFNGYGVPMSYSREELEEEILDQL